MTFTLSHTRTSDAGVFGQLKTDGLMLYTLEHNYNGWTKVPPGTYTCVRGEHQLTHGPIETFEITGVAGHTGLLFHPGNTEDDSEGCVLLGRNADNNQLYDSKKAFEQFMVACSGLSEFVLIVM